MSVDLKTVFAVPLDAKNFANMAAAIMGSFALEIKGERYFIKELEMYLYSSEHEDPTVHRNPDQKIFGGFYFHKFANGSYKGGTYKGLDITFGREDTYFGILIRSIQKPGSKIVSGPCCCVNELLEASGRTTVAELASSGQLRLVPLETPIAPDKLDLYCGPRVGLGKNASDYANKPYRFAAGKKGLKKQSGLDPVK